MKNLYNFPHKKIRLLLGLWMVLYGVPQMMGQNLLTESFNYPNGTALTSANWIQLSTGTPAVSVSSGNLLYPNTIGNGIGNKTQLSNTGQDVYRIFTSTALNATTQALYASATVNVTTANATGDYFLTLNNTNAALYIKSNGSGFSFGIQKVAGVGTVVYESTVRPFNTNLLVVLKYEFVSGTTNDLVKLYVNPATAAEPSTPDVSYTTTGAGSGNDNNSFSYVVLWQGTAANAPTLQLDGLNIATSWAGITTPIHDFGDTPVSYDTSKDNVFIPANHSLLSGLSLGSIAPDLEFSPANVPSGADNNGNNGDGTDEDAFTPASNPIRKGLPYAISVPVTNPSATSRYLYAWIDFDGDGKFESGEVQTVNIPASIGTTNQTVTFTPAQTSLISAGATKLYMRLRLSTVSLLDNTSDSTLDERSIGNGAAASNSSADAGSYSTGEVEDYQIDVVNTYEFGDAPLSYDQPAGTLVSARQLGNTTLMLGTTMDIESNPLNVTAGADNNGSNGDGDDEDGINTVPNPITPNTPYSVNILVTNTTGSPKILYGWIDFNNNGIFESTEAVTTNVPNNAASATLTWPATSTVNAIGTNLYMRLRMSSAALADNSVTANYDERAIGDGLNSGIYGSAPGIGEIEDYRVAVIPVYDFGDTPVSYDQPAGILVPARQLPGGALGLGATADVESTVQSVATGTDNNGSNGDGTDEDGINPASYTITPASVFTLPVSVRNTSGATGTLHGWLDLNNNGVFEVGEAVSISVPNNSTTVNLSWTAAQTGLISSSNVYLRLRITNIALADNSVTAFYDERAIGDGLSTGAYSTAPGNGEVEDYRLSVNAVFDFGDAPNTFEFNNNITITPARHLPDATLYLGSTFDIESGKNAVVPGADNGGTNGDGADEDGISGILPQFNSNTTSYSVNVNVYKTAAGTATLHGWIDMDGDGRFSTSEYTSATVTGTTGAQTVALTWASPYYFDTSAARSYMRLRFTTATLTDNTATPLFDERSIGDGLSTGNHGTVYPNGEIEDYPVPLPSPVVVDPNLDSDGDGVKDVNDLDSDNDGILNSTEGPVSFNDSAFRLYNTVNYQGTTAEKWVIYVTGVAGTVVTYTPYNGSATTATIPVSGILPITLSSSQVPNWPLNQVTSGKYVSLTSSAPVSILQEIFGDPYFAQDIAVVYPKSVWGTKYTVNTHYYTGNAQNNTGLTIISAVNNNAVTVKNKAGATIASFTLNDGQNYVFNQGGTVDINGYTITSSQNVGVMVAVSCANSPGSTCDNTLEYLLPDRLLGTKFLTKSSAHQGKMIITATQNNTLIKVNGAVMSTLNAGDTYNYIQNVNTAEIVETNKAVQFTKVVPYSGGEDPSVTTILDITKATLGPALLTIPPLMTISNDLVIFVRTSETSKMLYNGNPTTGWTPFSQDPSYSYTTITNSNGIVPGAVSTVSSTTGDVPFFTDWYGVGNDVSDATPLSIGGVNLASGAPSANSLKDTDGDGIPDYLDLDSDNDGCLDALEGDENVTSSMLVNAAPGLSVGTNSTALNKNLCAGTGCRDANGIPNVVNSGGAADIGGDLGQGTGTSINALIQDAVCLIPPFCYKPAATGTALETKHGITALARAAESNSNWPMVRSGAWTALESKEKGFVVNRVATTAGLSSITNPIEGMMVYDQEAACLKVYTIKEGETAAAWHCMTTQTCPDTTN
ncbi:GEVED domain-containing protein [Chryseobacterium caseinilyticum]|uniref:GEVED domain-containing protein n=1 Tax=Chryseobacterium caseinilyticum TaxID=2771428 RepID=A0ABR8ZG55_9FLAO|nr:GEVED domain-containing protein [Chryseobacterium caseinilyticum]MBD8084288.1 hypothetical protein [Chryseobacterium caseinilyticum]